ncbi:YciK family oxidoreductase [Aliikangiella coralliicola]|uniref:YciK family oxidoreductase n=1 Tax=Aliikangiella coralliicola TaxID=2592383 RepID=A0A545UAJ1_9GAMM|nr:YciK family oxidoreductase [Aliikangiella coralliicola]TQV86482.1 YciK family oxidoreductase [Aliikangiella coralliicola]
MQDYQPANNLLKDRVILVTGASDGIGKAVAREYAKVGATVVLHGRDIPKLEAVYDEIIADGSPKPAILPLNLLTASAEQFKSLAETIQSELGRLDGILHNAGMISELAPIEFTSAETWNQIIQVNLNAVYLLTNACMPLLRQSPSASIIMTSSGVGKTGRAFWGPYAVSKFAIEGLTQVMADELDGSNIRVNAINPGATRTKMRAKAYPAEDKYQLKTPEQITPTYLYLMGDDSGTINGQSIDAQPK